MNPETIEGAVQEAGGKLQSALGRSTSDPATQARGAVREAAGKAQGLYGDAKDQIRDTADDIADLAQDAYQNTGEYARRSAKAVANTVESYPVAYLLLAAGFGFLIATFLNERRR